MRTVTWNILDFIERYGEERVQKLISNFSTQRGNNEAPINPEIDNFLKKIFCKGIFLRWLRRYESEYDKIGAVVRELTEPL